VSHVSFALQANKEIESLRSQLSSSNGGTIASRMRALDDS